jgi:histone-lysine N-methyltransferase SETMAR
VKELLDVDRRVTLQGKAEILSLSYYAMQCILTEVLNMSKVAARWVPHILTEVDRQKRNLVQALRRKRPQLDLDDIILHHDNAPEHRAHDTELEIRLLGFSVHPHPPYSPDLAPLDFRLLPYLKKELWGQRFETSLQLRTRAREIISSFSSDWFKVTFDQLLHMHEKCVSNGVKYVEKVNRTLNFDVKVTSVCENVASACLNWIV